MQLATSSSRHRAGIYYWKCDRPAAFHGTLENRHPETCLDPLREVLSGCFPGKEVALRPLGGQGNHLTFRATVGGENYFVRVEDGPERDDYIAVESRILDDVRALGLPAPHVIAADASRAQAPFAWQVLENIAAPDLNQLLKQGALDLPESAEAIGRAVARWQAIRPPGFGPFDSGVLCRVGCVQGFHADYASYFFLHLDRHLDFLADRNFLGRTVCGKMRAEIDRHRDLLDLPHGCLVHKDLALWNILGTEREILAFIDWDDAISGDPMDDLSLLGCFYDGSVLARALRGYASVRPLPDEFRRRFWLHLLRNMIVKAVIRVGAGYFERGEEFFLIGADSSGPDLKHFTQERLALALHGLETNADITIL